jgi:hypothetical protein
VQAAAADSAPPPLAACLPYACLVRAPANRVLYRAAPLATGKRGRPRRHGDRFQGKDPATHGTPDATWSGTVADGTARTVRCWTGLHLRAVPQLGITVVCLTRAGAAGTTRDPKDTWFWWIGDPLPPLADLATLYDRRFRIEHGIRYDKQQLLWLAPKLRTPERAQLWTDVVSAAHNAITLGRAVVAVERFPWEDADRPLTPQQVRRAMAGIIAQVGTPAQRARPRGKSPGRARGTVVPKAPRHRVIRKGTKRRPRPAAA